MKSERRTVDEYAFLFGVMKMFWSEIRVMLHNLAIILKPLNYAL